VSAGVPHPTGEQYEISYEDQRAVVVEVGGGLRRYAIGDWDVVDGYDADEPLVGGRGQALIPWPNRLRDGRYEWEGASYQVALTEPGAGNAIHGLTRWMPWRAGETGPDRVVMTHRLHPQPGWPFTLDLEIAYVLGPGGLTVRTTAVNVGARACPFATGAHPYLTVGTARVDETIVQAPGAVRLLADERQIPVGEEPVDGTPYDLRAPRPLGDLALDDAFTALARDPDGRARVRLSAPEGDAAAAPPAAPPAAPDAAAAPPAARPAVAAAAGAPPAARPAVAARACALWMDEAYEWLMLFSGDTLPDPAARRRSLGIEPMTCAPNALQSGAGLLRLAPGEAFTGAWGVETGS
jgi:aldose 1-epimerase